LCSVNNESIIILILTAKTKIKNKIMIKLRLKKCGRKQQSSYRIVVMVSTSKRDGKAIEELGFYNPQTNESNLNITRINARLSQGAQPTDTVKNLLKRAGLIYEKN
jgi:small subunit ribosomal protein S16